MTNSEQYERTINYKAVFILSFCIIGIIFIWGMRYYTRIRFEKMHKEWALQNVQKVSDYLMKHGKVPFYQIYLNRKELGLSLTDFTSEYHRPTYRKALRYQSQRVIPKLSEEEFEKICCFVLEYNKVTDEYKLYDKYNPEISRMFRIEKKEVER